MIKGGADKAISALEWSFPAITLTKLRGTTYLDGKPKDITTGLSKIALYLRQQGLKGFRWLRVLGRYLNPVADAVAAYNSGYLTGLSIGCGVECGTSGNSSR
jgi:hypothetical protein